jgi:hypothetical protein
LRNERTPPAAHSRARSHASVCPPGRPPPGRGRRLRLRRPGGLLGERLGRSSRYSALSTPLPGCPYRSQPVTEKPSWALLRYVGTARQPNMGWDWGDRMKKAFVSLLAVAALAASAGWVSVAGATPSPDPDANGDLHSNCHTGSKGRGAGGEDGGPGNPKDTSDENDCVAAPVTPPAPPGPPGPPGPAAAPSAAIPVTAAARFTG